MLTRNDEITPHDKFISDNLTHKPDVAQSAVDNFAAGIVTAPYAVKSFDKEFNESPRGKTVWATYDALKRGNENPEVGWTQWGINEAANMIGQTLNPLGFLFAEVGGLLTKPITALGGVVAPQLFKKPLTELLGETMGKYFPETIGTEAAEKTLSVGLFGKELTRGFGIGAGAVLPQTTIDNFNSETGVHDILGMAKGMGAGGVFGMTLGTIPFAWGILKSNVNRLRGRSPTDPISPDEISKMVEEGVINEDTAQWIRELGTVITPEGRSEAKKYQEKATKFVSEQGHQVDTVNDTVPFEILSQDDLTNLQSATTDQMVADHISAENQDNLTNFVVQSGFEKVRDNPNLLDGVRGYVEHADENLYYRGYNQTIEHGSVSHHIMGKGYWMTPKLETAQQFGKNVEQIEGNFKTYDIRKGNDKKLNNIIKEIKDTLVNKRKATSESEKEKLSNKHNELIEKLRNTAKKKGYAGFQQYDEAEYMLFERPKNVKNYQEKPTIKSEILTRADEIVDQHIEMEHGELPLNQEKLYEIIRNTPDPERLPFYIPSNVKEFLVKNKEAFKKYINDIGKKFTKISNKEDLTKHEFYHGSGTLENIESFTGEKSDISALFGHGLYLTDNKRIALGYAKTRQFGTNSGKILGIKFKSQPKLIDVEQPPSKNVFKIIKDVVKKEYDVEIPETFKYDNIEDIFKMLRDEHGIYLDKINKELAKHDLNGYIHTGGLRVGKNAKHNVVVLFDKFIKQLLEQKEIDLVHEFEQKHEKFKSLSGKNEKRIKKLERQNEQLIKSKNYINNPSARKQLERNKQEIKQLKSNILKLKDPVHEMQDIKKNLLPLKPGYEKSEYYQRLQDLSEIWNPAKTLLDRINLERGIKEQEAYRDIAKQVLDMADSNVGSEAKIDKVNSYLQERTKERIDDHIPNEELIELARQNEIPIDADEMLAEHDRMIEMLDHENAKHDYQSAKEKFNEFRKSELVFKNLIKCVQGSLA